MSASARLLDPCLLVNVPKQDRLASFGDFVDWSGLDADVRCDPLASARNRSRCVVRRSADDYGVARVLLY